MSKPFKTYTGGKEGDGTYQKIINVMPPHDIYIELFLGNGAIFRHKLPTSLKSIGIDLDVNVINAWEKISHPGITLINAEAIQWLRNFSPVADIFKKLGVRVLIYIDPPYPKDSRRNQQNLYTHEMTNDQHTELLSVARSVDANIVVSSYPNKLYDRTLKYWKNFEFQAMTRGGTATEKVWFNYPFPEVLHDYRYMGNDYREREGIRGRISRNVSKFMRMPAAERNAIIEQLKQNKII
nr:hypothetical protein [uncultured Draconibacterium sp.]